MRGSVRWCGVACLLVRGGVFLFRPMPSRLGEGRIRLLYEAHFTMAMVMEWAGGDCVYRGRRIRELGAKSPHQRRARLIIGPRRVDVRDVADHPQK